MTLKYSKLMTVIWENANRLQSNLTPQLAAVGLKMKNSLLSAKRSVADVIPHSLLWGEFIL